MFHFAEDLNAYTKTAMKCFRCVCPNSGVGLANSFQLYLTVLGHTNLIFSLTDPTNPNFSKMKIKISHPHTHTHTHTPDLLL